MDRWLRVLFVSVVVMVAILNNHVARPIAQDNLGQISGIVLDGDRRPVADARVTLRPVYAAYSDSVSVPTAPNTPNREVLTAGNGTFLLTSVPPGQYFLVARKVGAVGGYFGQEKPGDEMQWFNLHPGEKTSGIVLRLWQGATIAGTVRTAAGSPLANGSVQLLEVRRENGVSRLWSLKPPVQTDDRGGYAFSGLSSGRYLVRTSAKSLPWLLPGLAGFRADSSAVFYPNTTFADAMSLIAIDAPAERTDIDITIPESVPGFEISGRIQGLPAAAMDRSVKLVLDDPGTVLPPVLRAGGGARSG